MRWRRRALRRHQRRRLPHRQQLLRELHLDLKTPLLQTNLRLHLGGPL
jgi:hypothetical protein